MHALYGQEMVFGESVWISKAVEPEQTDVVSVQNLCVAPVLGEYRCTPTKPVDDVQLSQSYDQVEPQGGLGQARIYVGTKSGAEPGPWSAAWLPKSAKYPCDAVCISLIWLMIVAYLPFALAVLRLDSTMLERSAMMEITTRSSMSVKPLDRFIDCFIIQNCRGKSCTCADTPSYLLANGWLGAPAAYILPTSDAVRTFVKIIASSI